MISEDGLDSATTAEKDLKVTVEKDLVSQAEVEDMEALLGTYAFLLSIALHDFVCKCLVSAMLIFIYEMSDKIYSSYF